jgi:hypothetical protein
MPIVIYHTPGQLVGDTAANVSRFRTNQIYNEQGLQAQQIYGGQDLERQRLGQQYDLAQQEMAHQDSLAQLHAVVQQHLAKQQQEAHLAAIEEQYRMLGMNQHQAQEAARQVWQERLGTQQDIANTRANAQTYGADQRLAGQQYAADDRYDASTYGADQRLAGQQYGADTGYQRAMDVQGAIGQRFSNRPHPDYNLQYQLEVGRTLLNSKRQQAAQLSRVVNNLNLDPADRQTAAAQLRAVSADIAQHEGALRNLVLGASAPPGGGYPYPATQPATMPATGPATGPATQPYAPPVAPPSSPIFQAPSGGGNYTAPMQDFGGSDQIDAGLYGPQSTGPAQVDRAAIYAEARRQLGPGAHPLDVAAHARRIEASLAGGGLA